MITNLLRPGFITLDPQIWSRALPHHNPSPLTTSCLTSRQMIALIPSLQNIHLFHFDHQMCPIIICKLFLHPKMAPFHKFSRRHEMVLCEARVVGLTKCWLVGLPCMRWPPPAASSRLSSSASVTSQRPTHKPFFNLPEGHQSQP